MTDSRARGRLGRLAAAFAVLLVVVMAARTTDGATVTDVVSIPEEGTVRADLLDNGTPVFVVHSPPREIGDAATIDVIQAFTTEVEGPVTGLVGWCARSQQFTQPHLGPLYDVRGRRLPASTVGRLPAAELFGQHTALDDLIQRQVTRIEGRDQPEDPVVVGGIQLLQDFQVAQRPALDPVVPPDRCRLAPQPLESAGGPASDGGGDGDGGRLRLLDHGFLAGSLDVDATGWQITTGWLLVTPDGAVAWCDAEPVAGRCGAAADVAVGFAFDPDQVGGITTTIGGPLAVRAHGGVIQRAAVLPGSTWRGSSLAGSEVLHGAGVGIRAEEGVLVVLAPAYATPQEGHCLARWPAFPVRSPARHTAVNIPVTADTDVRGLGNRLEVVVDAVTCNALSITDVG